MKCQVLEVNDNNVILENKDSIWWLRSEATFKLPKDKELKMAKEGDIVTITLHGK